jgi:hypothetical protein
MSDYTGIYHYPPELFTLLKDTMAVLCRSKRDVVWSFRARVVHSIPARRGGGGIFACTDTMGSSHSTH